MKSCVLSLSNVLISERDLASAEKISDSDLIERCYLDFLLYDPTDFIKCLLGEKEISNGIAHIYYGYRGTGKTLLFLRLQQILNQSSFREKNSLSVLCFDFSQVFSNIEKVVVDISTQESHSDFQNFIEKFKEDCDFEKFIQNVVHQKYASIDAGGSFLSKLTQFINCKENGKARKFIILINGIDDYLLNGAFSIKKQQMATLLSKFYVFIDEINKILNGGKGGAIVFIRSEVHKFIIKNLQLHNKGDGVSELRNTKFHSLNQDWGCDDNSSPHSSLSVMLSRYITKYPCDSIIACEQDCPYCIKATTDDPMYMGQIDTALTYLISQTNFRPRMCINLFQFLYEKCCYSGEHNSSAVIADWKTNIQQNYIGSELQLLNALYDDFDMRSIVSAVKYSARDDKKGNIDFWYNYFKTECNIKKGVEELVDFLQYTGILIKESENANTHSINCFVKNLYKEV